MAEVIMPKMGDAMTEGKIIAWRKQQGDTIQRGEPIAEIETEKVNVEIEAEESGTLTEILIGEGETAPVGSAIARIGGPEDVKRARPPQAERPQRSPVPSPQPLAPGAAAAERAAESRAAEGVAPPEARIAEVPGQYREVPAPPAAEGERVKASPLARRLAVEHGIDLARVTGTGPGSRIEKRDIEQYLEAQRPPAPAAPPAPPPPAPAAAPAPPGVEYEDRALSRMRQAIARAMTVSKPGAPHIYVTTEIDVTDALALRRTIAAQIPDDAAKPTVNDLILLATAKALRKVPELNAHFLAQDSKLRVFHHVHLGIAVAIPDGLIVAVLRDADQKPLSRIAAEAKDLGARAREQRLRQDEYMGATFTVSNLGIFDVDDFVAILNPPQVGILAVGTAARKPVVRSVEGQDQFVARDIMRVTLSADHRAVDGVTAARFLQELKRLLQSPLTMLV